MKDLNDEQLKNVTGGGTVDPNKIDMKAIEESACYQNCLKKNNDNSPATQRLCKDECLNSITVVTKPV